MALPRDSQSLPVEQPTLKDLEGESEMTPPLKRPHRLALPLGWPLGNLSSLLGALCGKHHPFTWIYSSDQNGKISLLYFPSSFRGKNR